MEQKRERDCLYTKGWQDLSPLFLMFQLIYLSFIGGVVDVKIVYIFLNNFSRNTEHREQPEYCPDKGKSGSVKKRDSILVCAVDPSGKNPCLFP